MTVLTNAEFQAPDQEHEEHLELMHWPGMWEGTGQSPQIPSWPK